MCIRDSLQPDLFHRYHYLTLIGKTVIERSHHNSSLILPGENIRSELSLRTRNRPEAFSFSGNCIDFFIGQHFPGPFPGLRDPVIIAGKHQACLLYTSLQNKHRVLNIIKPYVI